VYNSEKLCVEESMHVKFDDKSLEAKPTLEAEPTPEAQDEVTFDDQIIGNKESPRRTRSYFRQLESMIGQLSVTEPTIVDEALSDDGSRLAMQEELNQF